MDMPRPAKDHPYITAMVSILFFLGVLYGAGSYMVSAQTAPIKKDLEYLEEKTDTRLKRIEDSVEKIGNELKENRKILSENTGRLKTILFILEKNKAPDTTQ